MGCGSSRQLTPPPTPSAERKAAKAKKKKEARERAEQEAAREREAARRRASVTSESSGLPGTSTMSSNLDASDAALMLAAGYDEAEYKKMSPRTRNDVLNNCTFRPATNKHSAVLAERARARGGQQRAGQALFDRLATRRVRAEKVAYRPTKDDAYLEYVGKGGPGAELRAIARSKRKVLRARTAELSAVARPLKEGATGAGPSARTAAYRDVIDKVNHLNRAIGLLTGAIEQTEHKLYYAFEEWYAKVYAHYPDPPSPRSQAAATKIQAAYRGYAVRARPQTPYYAKTRAFARAGSRRAPSSRRAPRRRQRRRPMDEDEAAVKIQAAFRGYRTRAAMYDDGDDRYYGDAYSDSSGFRGQAYYGGGAESALIDGHWSDGYDDDGGEYAY